MALSWFHLYRHAIAQPLALDALADAAAAALLSSGNDEALRAVADTKDQIDLKFLCMVLDAQSVPVPDAASDEVFSSDG